MKRFHLKILSIMLIPALLFSFTGMLFHIHYCEAQNKIFADIHLIDNGELSSFCTNDSVIEKCCTHHGNQESIHISDHQRCCIDIQTEIETDKNYEYHYSNMKLLPAILSLLYTVTDVSSCYKIISNTVQLDFKPPEVLSTVVLLL